MKNAMAALVVLLSLTGCGDPATPSLPGISQTTGCIETVGDSITASLGPEAVGAGSINRGVPGADTEFVQKMIGIVKSDGPAVVFLAIGTNDLMRGNRGGLEARIAAIAWEFQPAKVYVVSLLPTDPRYPYNEHRQNADIVAINENLRHMFGADYVDTWSSFVKDGAMDPALSDDGLHPNWAGVEVIKKVYAAKVGRQPS